MSFPGLPEPIVQYLATNDSLAHAQLVAAHPDLLAILVSPQTRATLLGWLSGEGAWAPGSTSIVVGSLDLLRASTVAGDEQIIRSFLLHPDPQVRQRAYEFLLTIYFPDTNRQAMFLLLHGMLTDASDQVRAAATHYIRRVGAMGELREFLARWLKTAPALGWERSESYELVEQLLAEEGL